MTLDKNNPKYSILLWVIAFVVIFGYVIYENDPYDPYKGNLEFSDGTAVNYEILRSKVIGRDLLIALDTSPEVEGVVKYRRLASDDEWMIKDLNFGSIELSGHGKKVIAHRLNTTLPSLNKMAGKYGFIVELSLNGETLSLSGPKGEPIVSRYRGSVPAWVLIPHILFIMLSMLFAVRAALSALFFKYASIPLLWFTIFTLLLGGFIFGPLMQKYAFGVLWSGIPLGWDLTDNKVVVELLLWTVAAWLNTGKRKGGPWSVKSIALAGIITILIYIIPHSLLGSSYDYSTGQGVGTGLQ